MELAPGRRVGTRRLAEPRPGPPGFVVFALANDDELELILPNAHLRLRAGAREAWLAGRASRRAAATAAPAEVDWIDVDGWFAWVRPRIRGPLDVGSLDDATRASLAGWLVAGGVNLAAATTADLVVAADGTIRFAPLGLAEGQRPEASLCNALGAPAPAPTEVPYAPPGRPERAGADQPRSPVLPEAPAPPALVIVQLPWDNPALLQRVAARTGTAPRDVERAAIRPGRWLWAPVADPARALRLRTQAERAGFATQVVATGAALPSFLPTLVAGGLAQLPLYLHTGIPSLDIALIAGLGATAVVSLIRQSRRIPPARRAARALGAWEAWRRAEHTAGPERRLLGLEGRVNAGTDADPVRRELADALDHAWSHLFAVLILAEPQRTRALARIDAAGKRVEAALEVPEEEAAVRAITALRALR